MPLPLAHAPKNLMRLMPVTSSMAETNWRHRARSGVLNVPTEETRAVVPHSAAIAFTREIILPVGNGFSTEWSK